MPDARQVATAPDLPQTEISRIFPAPRALVFEAWSTADHVSRWFSPEGYSVPKAEIDFRDGGVFAVCMRAPDGQDFWCRGGFIEVAPPDRLVFQVSVPDDARPAFVAHTTVTFEEVPHGTRMTVRQRYELYDASFRRSIDGAPEGWRTTLDKFGKELERMQAIVERSVVFDTFSLERTYKAAPAVVFLALTDPAAKARWFAAGDGYTLLERQMDVRPGGRERVSGRWTSGMVSTFDAVYYDVVANERLIYAYEMHLDDRKISVSLATVQLQPAGTGTRLMITEQGAFLDGYNDDGSREKGTGFLLDQLGASLAE